MSRPRFRYRNPPAAPPSPPSSPSFQPSPPEPGSSQQPDCGSCLNSSMNRNVKMLLYLLNSFMLFHLAFLFVFIFYVSSVLIILTCQHDPKWSVWCRFKHECEVRMKHVGRPQSCWIFRTCFQSPGGCRTTDPSMFEPVNRTGVDLKLDLFVEDARGRQADSTPETRAGN